MNIMKTGKDINFFIFNPQASKVSGLRLLKFNIKNNHMNCSSIYGDKSNLTELPDKQILNINLNGMYNNTQEYKLLNNSAILGGELKCKIEINSDYCILGNFIINEFEIESLKSDLIFYKFSLLNSGKFNLSKV